MSSTGDFDMLKILDFSEQTILFPMVEMVANLQSIEKCPNISRRRSLDI